MLVVGSSNSDAFVISSRADLLPDRKRDDRPCCDGACCGSFFRCRLTRVRLLDYCSHSYVYQSNAIVGSIEGKGNSQRNPKNCFPKLNREFVSYLERFDVCARGFVAQRAMADVSVLQQFEVFITKIAAPRHYCHATCHVIILTQRVVIHVLRPPICYFFE